MKVGCLDDITTTDIIMPKLDGVYAFWDHKQQKLFSKAGNEFKKLDHIVCLLVKYDFDLQGELYLHGTSLQKIVSMVRNGNVALEYHIFNDRYIKTDKIIRKVPRHTNVIDPKQLFDYYITMGFEGIIIYNGNYRKIKPIHDMEGVIKEIKPGKRAGSLLLEIDSGKTVSCGGLKVEYLDILRPGQTITFIYDKLSDSGTPIHPRFKYIRSEDL